MLFTLKDYQSDAVSDVLAALADARDDFRRKGRRVAFSLTAVTGSGKTVMAAAVIESLFEGHDDFDFEPDREATVLWFTDDPSLNEQTRFRLMEAGDRIAHSRLVVVENTFNEEAFEPGKVYFLNSQKLRSGGNLVKGAGLDELFEPNANPDLRAFTIWDTIRNTIEDEHRTLYVILDEAHRGMRQPSNDDAAAKQTIVRRLVNGANGVPPVPIVWGISATVDRFNRAMSEAEGRTTYPPIVVDPARVQESGLLKDDIRLDFPADSGKFDLVLLARAIRKVRESTALWEEYVAQQDSPVEVVVPLLVVQIPNTPSTEMLVSAIETIRDEWPDLPPTAIAHVFGEHSALEVGPFVVNYISPERVQETTSIRVLFAKDAISTGWDCPRAEVLVSFRPARDDTHITQLLGRMVRTPLARRVPGNDKLNSVECVLPFFNRSAATAVAEVLLGNKSSDGEASGGSGGGDGRRVLIAPKDMTVNESVPEAVWAAFDLLPSQTLPKRSARPVKRLSALAQALSRDAVRAGARGDAYTEMFGVLDGLMARHASKIEDQIYNILEVEGETLVAGLASGSVSTAGRFSEVADERAVEADFKGAGRVLGPDLARAFADHIAQPDSEDDGLFDAHLKVAALAQVEGVKDEIEREADKLAAKWFAQYRVAIKGLSDDRRAVYESVLAQSTDPQVVAITRPKVRTEETRTAQGEPVRAVDRHLMAGTDGLFPIGSLNSLEVRVLDKEMATPGFRAWYRNPARASADSLAIAYNVGPGNWRRLCPDFVFFRETSSGEIEASIVDPHGYHLADALPKLRGLAQYAAEFGAELHRIEAVAEMKDTTLRVLDLLAEPVRSAIDAADDAEKLYLSDIAEDY